MADDDPRLARLSQRLRAAREDAGLTVAEVAHRAGISQPYVTQIEVGTRVPTIDVLIRLADALGVPPAQLLSE